MWLKSFLLLEILILELKSLRKLWLKMTLLSMYSFNFSDSLLALVKDKYGNYVIQKIIEVSDSSVKDMIIRRIVSSQSLKKRDGFCMFLLIILAKHVINFIEKLGINFQQYEQSN